MSHSDASKLLDLDGRLLALFLAVFEENSITRAAQRLGVTQSAVSHLLDRLRALVGDPLFVRAGRSIEATPLAHEMAPKARALLAGMAALTQRTDFELSRWEGQVTIAANDMQRDLLLPGLAERLRREAPGVRLRVVPSGAPGPELLRDSACDLLITPRPPDAGDVVHRRLFEDRYRVFFDSTQLRDPPAGRTEWLACDHITVVHASGRQLDIDHWLHAHGVQRRMAVTVTGFGGLPAFLRQMPLCCTMPGLLGEGLLRGFTSIDCPVDTPPMPMYLCWHQRQQTDPANRWLREALFDLARPWQQPASGHAAPA